MRRLTRVALRLLQAAFLVSVVAVALALAVLTGRLPAATRMFVEWGAGRVLGAEVRVGRFRGSLLDTFELEEVSIAQPNGPAIAARSIRIDIAELSPAQRRVVLESLGISGAMLYARGNPEGWSIIGWELPSSARETQLEDNLFLVVRRLSLTDIGVDLEYRTPSGETGAAAVRFELEANEVHWPPNPPHAWPQESRADLLLERGSWAGREIAEAGIAVHQVAGALDFELTGDVGGTLEASGKASLAGSFNAPVIADVQAALRFRDLDLERVLGDPAFDSALTGELRGAWDGAIVTGGITLEPSQWGTEEIRSAEVAGRLWTDTGDWNFELDTARVTAAFADVEARVKGDALGARSLTVRRLALDLAALPPRWRPRAEIQGGRVDAEADLAGPWQDLRGRWALSLDEVQWGDRGLLNAAARGEALGGRRLRVERLDFEPVGLAKIGTVRASSPFEVEWRASGASVEGARLHVADGVLEVDGGYDRRGFRKLQVGVRDLELNRVVPAEFGIESAGRLGADFVLDGPLQSPRITGSLAVRDPKAKGVVAERIDLEIAPAPGAAHLHAVRGSVMQGGVQRVEFDARVPSRDLLIRPRTVAFQAGSRAVVTLRQLELTTLAPLLSGALAEAAGRVDGVLRAAGPLESFDVAGQLTWHEPRWRELRADRIELEVDSATPSRWRGDLAMIRDGVRALDAHFEALGQGVGDPVALLRDPALRISVALDSFALEWLQPLAGLRSPALSGRVDGALRIVGGDPVPWVEGELEFLDLRAAGPPLPDIVGPASGRMTLLGLGARLDEIRLVSGDGEARLSGRFEWDDPSDAVLSLRLQFARFEIVQPGTIEGLLDGDITVEGHPRALRTTGGLLLYQAMIDLPEIEDPVVREIRVRGLPDATEPESIFEEDGGLLSSLEADVALRVGDSVELRGLGAELELSGELRVRKRPGREPGLFGSVETTTGRIDFRRKWLRVERGTAVFDGSPEPDPYLDVTGVHRVRDVEIRIRIFGKASEPQIELESDPPLSSEEQLAYLLFDRPLGELGEGDQEQLGTAAGILAADALLGEFGTAAARAVGLDRIRLGVDEEQAPTLEIEKQVHPRLTARYGRSFGTEGGDRFVLEWRLFRRLFLTGEQRTSGDSGVGLLWRYDF